MKEYEDVEFDDYVDAFFKAVDSSYVVEALREVTYNEDFVKSLDRAFKANDRCTVGELVIDALKKEMMSAANEKASLDQFDKVRKVI